MDQIQLRSAITTNDPSAENTVIAQYLGTLEGICAGIAARSGADAEDLLSEGYVQLVTAFRDLVNECRDLINDKQNDKADEMIANMTTRLTHLLTLKLTQYVKMSSSRIDAESADALVDTANEPSAEDSKLTSIPMQLINPFTRIAELCHKIGGSCFPPEDSRVNLIMEIVRLYQISTGDANALLKSYETYVEGILEEHFNSRH